MHQYAYIAYVTKESQDKAARSGELNGEKVKEVFTNSKLNHIPDLNKFCAYIPMHISIPVIISLYTF